LVDLALSAKSVGHANTKLDDVATKLKRILPQIDQLNNLAAKRTQTVSAAQKEGLFAEGVAPLPTAAPNQTAAIAQQTASQVGLGRSGQFVIPTTPDPLAISMLYETYFTYENSPSDIEAYATKKNMDAFAKCMIAHRTSQVMRPNELWEFVSHSAAIVRAHNLANAYYPPALRFRTVGNRKAFDFYVKTKSPSSLDLTKQPLNALSPANPRVLGLTFAEVQNLIGRIGLPDPNICAPNPARRRQERTPVQSDDDGF
jgi:hypothetical protein